MQFFKLFIAAVSLFALIGFSSCGSDSTSNSGTLSLNLTDAPLVDEDNVTGVYISITGIEYHTSQGGWKTMGDFNTSINPINLLDWQDGNSISLGDFQMPAGKYTQMRFMLDAAEESQLPKSNTGCFIEISDVNQTLYVPSGSQTGYKAIGNYDVPINGTVTMTADFDVRKSVVVSGNGSYYKLKPTIKLVVTDEAGKIKGTISNLDVNTTYVIYAYEYENGSSTWDINETIDPDPSDAADIRFPNSVTSATVKSDGNYTLAFLAAGTYDLVVAEYNATGVYLDYSLQTDDALPAIDVVSDQTTTFNWPL